MTNTDVTPAHQTPGASPTAIAPGDRLTIARGDHGMELGVIARRVYRTVGGGVRIDWFEIDADGRAPHDASAGSGTDVTGCEGGTWHWWNTRRPVDDNPNNPPGRARIIHATGDGRTTYHRARRYVATVAVFVAPPNADRASGDDHPGLRLTVAPDGTWTLAHEQGGTALQIIAAGHIDRLPIHDGTPGQDRESYTDTQDRESYTTTA